MREEIDLWLLVRKELKASTENYKCRYANIEDCVNTMIDNYVITDSEGNKLKEANYDRSNTYDYQEMAFWITRHLIG
jgi:hypothetical protein